MKNPLNYKKTSRMTAIESMHSLSNLKYVGIFNYIEDTVFMIKRNQAIYTRLVYVQKDI